MKMQVRVYGLPAAQPRPRAFKAKSGKVRMYEAGTAEAWKGMIVSALQGMVPHRPLTGPLRVDIEFLMPRPKSHFGTGRNAGKLKDGAAVYHDGKPDRDNLDKAVLDCLTQLGVWHDDGQVSCGEIVKRYADDLPGAVITIETLEVE